MWFYSAITLFLFELDDKQLDREGKEIKLALSMPLRHRRSGSIAPLILNLNSRWR
jgi:hypothetical protein